jgi:MFS family permease
MSRGRFEVVSPTAILFVLAAINLLNYVDRQIIGPLVPLLIQPVEEGGLGLSRTQAGLLQTAFMIVHSLASIPMGLMADRYARRKLIAAGVAVWSVATALAAFARGFPSLFFARGAVGIGEATYAPAASALISDSFPPQKRAFALGIFQAGMMIGGGIAVVLGGWMGTHYGWRTAFLVVGVPGLLFALLALAIREPAHGGGPADPQHSITLSALRRDGAKLLAQPRTLWIYISGILITFFVGALVYWAPAFVLSTYYGGDESALGKVTATFGAVIAPAALLGTLGGSYLADRAERVRPGRGHLLVIAIGVMVAGPLAMVGVFVHDVTVLYVCMGLGVFFNSWYVGPILAALHESVPEHLRGTATGVYFLVIHLLGDAISPTVVGFVADRTGSLSVGVAVAIAVGFFGGVAALIATRKDAPGPQPV